jgi:branched-chain amino acid transport system permease protein
MHVATLTDSRIGYYYIFLGVLVAVLSGLYWLLKGRTGRFMTAVRDDPVGAGSRGIGVVRIKMIAFCTSCGLCGLAGSLYGTFSQLVSPELGLLQQTGLVLSMVVIGGMGSLTGSLLGAVIVYLGSEWLRAFGNIQIIVFALLVMLFARYVPGGLWGLASNWLRGRRKP